MKLIICIVLAVAAVVAADEGFYPQSAQSAPDSHAYYNNYEPELPKRNGWLDRLFGSNRRQGLAGLLGGLGGIGAAGPIIAVVAVVIVVAVGLTALNTVISNINSSGRDLGTDDWEINHSVWMDQLQQEFEDSWETHKLM
ncbi:uncharacterized protein LOC119101192 [Pollicipes pollicipes]|uniref:uncharacterized protein LOC119101192 n=1 Tax=Pollicipes pollicipes TaxID=41117 RepID=UPI0018854726|nr:uncharacterized protein LOC119101192 [Pollicipes pollicipes]